MRGFALLLISCLLALFFVSCKPQSPAVDLQCSEIALRLADEISGEEEYLEYSDEDISFLPFLEDCKDISVLYSRDSTDIGELGVIKVDIAQSKVLAKKIESYLAEELDLKSAFLKSYAPEEIEKLEGACVERYGEYIIFTVLASADARAVFEEADKILK